ncbi:hypothetical protein Acr_18g0007950 [Actinidia rufa]|uniref:RNase H type-1 domain-containing protein n=1 Tax=Actinidia rufa TaxID=165716 RepID=A0A7J0G755_9ERIC|nr:hypothetical protein Acr_18g0007950 [Actinidia rufa]
MEPRQVISIELARATSEYSSDRPEPKYCLLLALGRGRVLRISISRLSISTRILFIHGNYPLRDSLLHDTNNCGILSRWQSFQLCLLYLRDIFPYSSFRGSRRDPWTRPITPSIKRPLPHHSKVSGSWEFQARDDGLFFFPRDLNDFFLKRSALCKEAIQSLDNRRASQKVADLLKYELIYTGSGFLHYGSKGELLHTMVSARKNSMPSLTITPCLPEISVGTNGPLQARPTLYVALAPSRNWSPMISPKVAEIRTLLTEVKRVQRSAWNLAKLSPLSSPRVKVLSPPRPWASRYLPRPSASSPPDNRAHPMANPGQIPDLEGLHREIHGMAEQMRIMNENNRRLMQLLAAANPPLPVAPVPDIKRSRHSNRSGDHSQNISTKTNARLDAINTGTNAPVTVDTLIRQTEPPFTQRVLRARISLKFKLQAQLGIYEGKTDPMDHLDSYKSLMSLQGCSDEVMCKPFSATLKGPARSWFRKLSPGTIDSFGDLSRLFVANFMSCRNRQKNASHLFTIRQKETKSLKDFVKRFNQAILEVEDPSDKVIIMAMMEGLRPGLLFDSLSKNVPETLSALQSKADKYITAEELAEAKRRRRGKDDHKRKEPDTRQIDYREETRYKRLDRDPKRSNDRSPRTPPRRLEFILPPLNAHVAQVLSEIKHEEFVKWPGKIKTDPQKRNRNKYCEFHRDHGHNTEDCFQLKEQIADLIKRGYLRKYVVTRPPPNSPERRYGDNRPTMGNIQTIHGGFGSGGCSTSFRKKHDRSALRLAEEEIYNLSSSSHGCGAGLVIQTLSGEQMEYAIRMGFKATNNEAEYEALLAGLRVAVEIGAQSLEIFSDSQLVVNQVQGDYPRQGRKNDGLFGCVPLEFLASPSIGVANQILQTEESPTWMDEIIAYLQEGTRPKDTLQARRLQYRSARFCIFKGRLYKRAFSGPLLKCLRPEEAEYVLKEIHEGICCGNHSGARSLARKTIRQGYFWLTIERDAATYVRRCNKCQRFAPVSRLPHTEMFARFHPEGLPGNHGQRKQFDKFGIGDQSHTILRNLKARLERSKCEWTEDLPSILWAYHTTSGIPTGETLYSMVFGTESVIPVEIGMPSFRTLNFNKESNEAELRLNLNLLEEKREKAEIRQAAYKCQVAKYYNQRVRHRSFLPGDLVLRRVTLSTKEPNAGKLGPTWEGPYKVIKVSKPGTCWLEDLNGKALLHPWNAKHLKKYYQ